MLQRVGFQMVPTVVGHMPRITTDALASHRRHMQVQIYDSDSAAVGASRGGLVEQRRAETVAITAAVGASQPAQPDQPPQPPQQQPQQLAPAAVGAEEPKKEWGRGRVHKSSKCAA